MSQIPPKIQIPEQQVYPQAILDAEGKMVAVANLTHYHNIQLLSHPADYTLYTMPSSSAGDAHIIWKDAGLPPRCILRMIEIKMIDWVRQHAKIELDGDVIHSVTCYMQHGILHFTSWRVFLRWFLCASNAHA